MKLAVVTATIAPFRAEECVHSWLSHATGNILLYVVGQGNGDTPWTLVASTEKVVYSGIRVPEILGVVPAFALGVQKALDDGADIVACLHDDLRIEEDGWDQTVINLFRSCPRAGLCGFGGAKGLGSDDLYQTPYNPMQLARQRFLSNMRHAEAHGERWELATPVACLDGFSLIGRAEFWRGQYRDRSSRFCEQNLFAEMQGWNVIHHAYDSALGAWAKRLGWQVWYLPVKVHHHGGLTAVADTRYHQWADTQRPEGFTGTGDQAFWEEAHRQVYTRFRDVLPIRT